MNLYSYIPNMYILGGQVYEDEEIKMNYEYNSIYEQNPDEYIVEDYVHPNDYDSFAVEFMEKMKIMQSSVHFS